MTFHTSCLQHLTANLKIPRQPGKASVHEHLRTGGLFNNSQSRICSEYPPGITCRASAMVLKAKRSRSCPQRNYSWLKEPVLPRSATAAGLLVPESMLCTLGKSDSWVSGLIIRKTDTATRQHSLKAVGVVSTERPLGFPMLLSL